MTGKMKLSQNYLSAKIVARCRRTVAVCYRLASWHNFAFMKNSETLSDAGPTSNLQSREIASPVFQRGRNEILCLPVNEGFLKLMLFC